MTDPNCVLLQVVTDADGSVMDSFTLHKPVGWKPNLTDKPAHWEHSIYGLTGPSGHASKAAQGGMQENVMQDVFRADVLHCSWVQDVIQYMMRLRHKILQQLFHPRHIL